VTIVIRERRPVAVADPGRWLVAADGVVLAKASRGTRLPRIEPGIAIRPNARMAPTRMQLAVARTLARALRPLVRAVRTRPGGHVELVLSGGGVAVLGTMADLARKEAALFQVLRWAHRRTVAVKTVDVRIWTAPTLVLDHG
jgi:hypothetical protein